MSIYTKEVQSSDGLFLKWSDGDEYRIRIFGEGLNYTSRFQEGDKEREQFATLVLWRNLTTKESEVKAWTFGPMVQKLLRALAMDDDWGHPDSYDIVVAATGEKMDRKYTVVPKPKKDLSEKDEMLIVSTDIDLAEIVKKSPGFVEFLNPDLANGIRAQDDEFGPEPPDEFAD